MVSVFVRQTLVQIVTPDAMRGRVSAVSSLFIGASNELGEFESGGMARLLGPVGSAIFGGCGAIVVTLLWAGIFPALTEGGQAGVVVRLVGLSPMSFPRRRESIATALCRAA